MTDALHTVTTTADLQVNAPSGREREAIAQLLSDGARGVVWVPEWLMDQKDLRTVEGLYRLAVGELRDYSDDALAVRQPDADDRVFLPKSQVEAFVLADAVDTVETPQAGLSDYGRDA